MKLKDFLKNNKIKAQVFADACEIEVSALRMYIYQKRLPPLYAAYKIIVQSNYMVSIEDLIPHEITWKHNPKLEAGKIKVDGKLKKHERKQYFKDLAEI